MNQSKVKICCCCCKFLCEWISHHEMFRVIPPVSSLSRVHFFVLRNFLFYSYIQLIKCLCFVWPCRQLCVVSGERNKVDKYSSVGLDGAMVIWDFKVLVLHSLFVWFYWPLLSVTYWMQCKQCLLLSVWGKLQHFCFLCSIKTPHYVWGHRSWSDPPATTLLTDGKHRKWDY